MTDDKERVIPVLAAKEMVRKAYDERKSDWTPGDVVEIELGRMYTKAVENIDDFAEGDLNIDDKEESG